MTLYKPIHKLVAIEGILLASSIDFPRRTGHRHYHLSIQSMCILSYYAHTQQLYFINFTFVRGNLACERMHPPFRAINNNCILMNHVFKFGYYNKYSSSAYIAKSSSSVSFNISLSQKNIMFKLFICYFVLVLLWSFKVLTCST